MAIESLMTPQPKQEPEIGFRHGTPDVLEAVGVTLELYKELGYAGDPDEANVELIRDFTKLADLGYAGRMYVPAPAEISFGSLLSIVEGKRPEGVAKADTWMPYWKPGTQENSVTDEELDAAPEEGLARIALFNADTETGVDLSLHYLGLPFDDYARKEWGGDKTQQEALEDDQLTFAVMHPDFTIEATDHREAIVLAGMDRIRGVEKVDPKNKDFYLNTGWMRIPELGRRAVDGASILGYVYSDGGQLGFSGDHGGAGSGGGVGLSAGQNQLKPHAS